MTITYETVEIGKIQAKYKKKNMQYFKKKLYKATSFSLIGIREVNLYISRKNTMLSVYLF